VVICLERGADLHTAQLMPLPLTVCCFSKIQIGFTFLVPAHLGSPEKRAVKRVCVCLQFKGKNHHPRKMPIPLQVSGPPTNRWFLGPTQVHNRNSISIGSSVFAGLTAVSNRQTQTDRPRYIDGNKPHLMLHIVIWAKSFSRNNIIS